MNSKKQKFRNVICTIAQCPPGADFESLCDDLVTLDNNGNEITEEVIYEIYEKLNEHQKDSELLADILKDVISIPLYKDGADFWFKNYESVRLYNKQRNRGVVCICGTYNIERVYPIRYKNTDNVVLIGKDCIDTNFGFTSKIGKIIKARLMLETIYDIVTQLNSRLIKAKEKRNEKISELKSVIKKLESDLKERDKTIKELNNVIEARVIENKLQNSKIEWQDKEITELKKEINRLQKELANKSNNTKIVYVQYNEEEVNNLLEPKVNIVPGYYYKN